MGRNTVVYPGGGKYDLGCVRSPPETLTRNAHPASAGSEDQWPTRGETNVHRYR